MCHKLFQEYHCGCIKIACITPCPHAIAAAVPAAPPKDTVDPNTRSKMSTPAHSDIATLPSQRGRGPVSPSPSTLRTSSSTTTLVNPTITEEIEAERIPTLCTYFFTRKLPKSAHPCLKCYMQPQYADYRKRWMDDYRAGHPGVTQEIERLAGIEQIPGRMGLVNVEREMERMGSVVKREG